MLRREGFYRLYDIYPEQVVSLAILVDEEPGWEPKRYKYNASERLRWKVELVRQLYARGYERDDVHGLFRFIDWLLVLPDEMTKSFRESTAR